MAVADLRLIVIFVLVIPTKASESGVEDELLSHTKRAIGGESFEKGTWPWLVGLTATIVTERLFGIFQTDWKNIYCGGSLISDRWVLSAAHCFKNFGEAASRPEVWEARFATVKLEADTADRILDIIGLVFDQNDLRVWEVDVDKIITHPDYNKSSLFSDDIALLRLAEPVPVGDEFSLIQAIQLPDPEADNFPEVGQMCVSKGWGCTSKGGLPSETAKQIKVPIYSSWKCFFHYWMSMSNRICAGYRDTGIGMCSGDSGGPLACQTGDNYTLAGVVSFTSRDNPGDYPAVFTRVQDYIPWINEVIRTNTD